MEPSVTADDICVACLWVCVCVCVWSGRFWNYTAVVCWGQAAFDFCSVYIFSVPTQGHAHIHRFTHTHMNTHMHRQPLQSSTFKNITWPVRHPVRNSRRLRPYVSRIVEGGSNWFVFLVACFVFCFCFFDWGEGIFCCLFALSGKIIYSFIETCYRICLHWR